LSDFGLSKVIYFKTHNKIILRKPLIKHIHFVELQNTSLLN
jgi:hypothetical protein